MKRIGFGCMMLLMFFLSQNIALAQSISNEGTDFWAVFPTHDPSRANENAPPELAKVRIYVTSKSNSEITVRVSCNGYSTEKTILPNTATPFDVPRPSAYIEADESNRILDNRGIHIVSVDGSSKVAVYEHIYAGARSAASLILPNESLGQKYYSMNYTQDRNGNEVSRNFLSLVAIEPNTTLLIHEKNGNVIRVPFTSAGEVYQYMPSSYEDLTGVYIEVDPESQDNCSKRFAAFSGSTSLRIGCSGSRDPLFQQLYPTTSWGKSYGIVPFIDRQYHIRILAQEDNTAIHFNGQDFSLNSGEFYETPEALTQPSFISANKKISVAQYSLTQACSSASGDEITGDPEMVLLNPIEFNIKATTLFSSNDENITEKYINVCIKTSAASSFKINGVAVTKSWTAIPSNPEYSFIQLPVSDESSYLTANDGFNAIAYGFGRFESYSYSAGTNLAANNYLLVSNTITKIDAQNACIGQASDFKIILPYIASKIIWTLDDGPGEAGDLNYKTIQDANGVLSYEYLYQKNKTFDKIASHKMTVVTTMPNQENCLGGDITYNFNFDVYPIPTLDFAFDADACPDTELLFTDKSFSNITDRPINKWLWDFGDGETSAEQNPRHVYNSSGTFIVKLLAGLDDGCFSETSNTISIRPKITPEFVSNPVSCVQTEIAFHDESAVESGPGTVKKWYWNFGDNATSEDQRPKHMYSAPGSYVVSLIAETENGCKSLPFEKTIVIKELPKADFSLPRICVNDPIAEFKNLSAETDGSTQGLRYLWDFGDAGSPDNTSGQVDGTHKYHQAGPYTVTLTVINDNGCQVTISKEFFVNGSDIMPFFEVQNERNLCGNEKVIIRNTSTVDVGSITKIVWYMDAENKPAEFIEDNNPEINPEGIYEFLYPTFASPLPKTFTIRMLVFSGLQCSAEISKDIVVNAAPSVHFSPIDPVCINSGKVQIQTASEILNVQGIGKYTGKGVTELGEFDPVMAGVGLHLITYTFISSNGCSDMKSQTIEVYPIPVLNIERDMYILAGGEKRIEAEAAGMDLRFKWQPVAGLSQDDILNPVVQLDADQEYTLTISSGMGCSITEKIYLHVINSIDAANAFTPNGDGVNDTWNLKYIESYPQVTVEIFNRYGESVFFSKGYSVPFDGNYKNQPLPLGTYYYIIDPKNGKKRVTGSLTILK